MKEKKKLFKLEKSYRMDGPTIIFSILGAIIAFFVGVYIMRWIFQIESIVKNQEILIRTLEETVIQNERIYKLNLAQLELTASITNEADVRVEDINEVTEKFGIKFNIDSNE